MSKRQRRLEAKALVYVAPWVTWLTFLPLALVFSLMALSSTPAAFFTALAEVVGGAYLLFWTWGAYGQRKNQQTQIHAVVTAGVALVWLFCASAFGLFHKPDVDVWPEFWRLPEFAVKAFTLPIWGSWFAGMVITSAVWNVLRVARPEKGDEIETEVVEESPLSKALDGAALSVEATVGTPDAPVIKGTIKGKPGQVGAELAGKGEQIASLHGLRSGAVRIVPDPAKASDAKIVVMPKDPHAESRPWPGPSHPGAWIDEFPIPVGPHTDGEIAEIWMTGDEETGRPNQHVAVAGMNGSGKSRVGWVVWGDALTRKGFRLVLGDISGKIWQTAGPIMPYIAKLAGLHGASDEDRANNVLDGKDLLDWIKKDAAERQIRWGKVGIVQWERRCFTEFGDEFTLVVLEEAPDLLKEMGDEAVALARLLRSAGYKLWITAQRFDWNSVPTSLRSQLAAVFVFGMNNTADMNMIVPEDVEEVLSKQSIMNTPAGWQNNQPGKVILAAAGIPQERRSDPVRTYRTDPTAVSAFLAEYVRPLWTDVQIEAMKNGTFPDGILVRTSDVQSNVRTGSARVHDDGVYRDPELDDVHADPNEPVRMRTPEDNDTLPDSGYELDPDGEAKVPTERFRAIVQQHLASLLAQGRGECGPKDILHMQPPTGRGRQHIAGELRRLSARAEPWEVSTITPDHDRGSGKAGVYKLVPPREIRTEVYAA